MGSRQKFLLVSRLDRLKRKQNIGTERICWVASSVQNHFLSSNGSSCCSIGGKVTGECWGVGIKTCAVALSNACEWAQVLVRYHAGEEQHACMNGCATICFRDTVTESRLGWSLY